MTWVPKTLTEMRQYPDDIVTIYTDGVYDLFHPGHVKQLEQVKNAFKNVRLIVGVCTDKDTFKYKHCYPVMTESERQFLVQQCRFVDEILTDPPFSPTIDFANSIQADLVAHDAIPYPSPTSGDSYNVFKQADRFFETKRTESVSTTDIIDRILTNIDIYRDRQALRSADCIST